MADLEQRRRTVRVLGLLDESFQAHQRGDMDAMGRLIDQAAEVDAFAVSGVQGGIYIGEIPDPNTDYPAWAEYVQYVQAALAAAEADAGGDGDG